MSLGQNPCKNHDSKHKQLVQLSCNLSHDRSKSCPDSVIFPKNMYQQNILNQIYILHKSFRQSSVV